MGYGRKRDFIDDLGPTGLVGCFGFLLAMVAAWITHVIWIIDKLQSDVGATVGQMVLGALGTIVPPVGVIHGVMLWVS